MSANIHIYPAPIVGESRIFKQTGSVTQAALFSEVIVCGTATADLPRSEALSDGRTIMRVGRAVPARSDSVLRRIVGQVTWSLAVLRTFRKTSVSAVNAHSVAVLPVSYALSRIRGAALIYDTHELETESSSSTGIQAVIYRWVERALIRKCDAVFVVNESIAAWYEQNYRGIATTVVRNIPDAHRPERAVDLRGQLAVPQDKRLYIHVGNLTTGRSVSEILDAFSSDKVDDHVVFLGDGPLRGEVENRRSENPNIHWVPPVDSARVLEYVAGSDVALCLIEPTCLSYELSLPNKALEYVMAETPFFHTPLPEIARLMANESNYWTVTNPKRDLADAIVGVTDEELDLARTRLEAIRLPTWSEESARMVKEYELLLEERRQP